MTDERPGKGADEPGNEVGAVRVRPVDLRDYADFSPDEPRRIRVTTAEHVAVDLWCLQPRQSTPVIEAAADVSYTVLGGRSWFVTEDGEVGLDPLGSMLVPAGVVHGIDNRAADPLVVVAVSSPVSAEPEAAPVGDSHEAVQYPPAPGALRQRLRGLLPGD